MLHDRNIIYFSSNDWESGVRTSSYHVARFLSQRNKILYIESIGLRAPKASAADMKRITKKLSSCFKGLKKIGRNFYIYTPIVLPLHNSEIARCMNKQILIASIKYLQKRLHMDKPISWIFHPHMGEIAGHFGESLIVYYCIDEFSAFPEINQDKMKRMETKLLKKADVVFATAQPLVESKREINPETYFSPHGVDFDHFSKASSKDTNIPKEIDAIKRPIIGFFGLIREWLDMELIKHLATKCPDLSIVLIGKSAVDTSTLNGVKNIHLLGHKDYSTLPSYAKAFDVCIIPFKVNELTRNVNPIKLREYLAMGKPVVSTYMLEVAKYKVVEIAETYDEFVKKIELCLKKNQESDIKERQDSIRTETWQYRMEKISEIVEQKIGEKGERDLIRL